MGSFRKWLGMDSGGREDVVQRERDGKKSFFESIKSNIQEHPELITAAAAAVGTASNNMSAKDIMMLVGAGYLAYRHFENKANRKELFEGVKENISEFGGKVLGKAKDTVNEYKQEKAEQKAAFEEQQEMLLNPRGYFSDAYTVADVGKFAAELTPTRSTSTFKEMSPEDQKEYLEFVDAKDQHRVNYDNAFAKKGVSIYECAFYDNDGKRVNPFSEINPDDSYTDQINDISKNQTAKDALIHGMDCGYIKCKLPDGTDFDPKKVREIRNDRFSKNAEEMSRLDYKYSGVQAAIDSDKMEMFTNVRPEDIKAAMPKGLSDVDIERFKIEVGGMIAYAKFESIAYDTITKSFDREYSSPYDMMLKSIGASVPEERKLNVVKEDTVQDESKSSFNSKDEKKDNKYSKDDFADVEDAIFRDISNDNNKTAEPKADNSLKRIIDATMNKAENMTNDKSDKDNQFE